MSERARFVVILPDGTTLVRERNAADPPSLKELQEAVGGLIQPCDNFLTQPKMKAYCNEEGILLGLPENLEGSRAVRWPVGTNDLFGGRIGPLHGPVVILDGFEDEDCDEDA